MPGGSANQQGANEEGGVMHGSMIAVFLAIAAIGAGLMASVYFTFSEFIMRSLAQLGATRATAAMNAINEVILCSWFMVLFFGSTLLYVIITTIALVDGDMAGRWLLFATGLIYVFGMFLCTVIFNVPLNKGLAEVSNDNKTKTRNLGVLLQAMDAMESPSQCLLARVTGSEYALPRELHATLFF
jgi:uncharacterized membrane protein